jgi:hypothetical protein
MHLQRSIVVAAMLGTILLQSALVHAQVATPEIFKDPAGNFHVAFTTPQIFDNVGGKALGQRFDEVFRMLDRATGSRYQAGA